MSRLAVLLLVAAFFWSAPGLALGDEKERRSSRTPPVRSEASESCPVRSGATWSGTARHCPAQGEDTRGSQVAVQEMPVYIPPNAGSPSIRIGGGSRGGTPARSGI